MIRKFIAHLTMKFSRAVRAIKAGIGSAIYYRGTSVIPVYDVLCGFVAAIRTTGEAVQAWPLKKTSRHAPVFSLFTFLGDRPTP
jgi:hypothetical protein